VSQLVNLVGNLLVDAILFPFRGLAPVWGLTALSLVTGVAFLFVFKWTSNQAGIADAKQKVKAHLLELRLYAHDMVLTFRAQRDLFVANLRYIRHTLRPMILLLVPVILLLVHLDVRYGLRPLAVGETTLLRVRLSPAAPAGAEPTLTLPPGLALDAPPLRIPPEREFCYRLKATSPGDHRVQVAVGGAVVPKSLQVEGALAPLSSEARQPSLFSGFANPAETPLPSDGPVQSIAVDYPARDLRVAGHSVHWLLFFFVVSVVPAYLVKGLLGVEA
jgi:uncharacterized membrane protein (DUF106 family)